MAFKLKQGESAAKGITRIIGEEIDEAIRRAKVRRALPVENVHEIRKSVKKMRALLRLMRESLGERTYRCESMFLRDVAHQLSDARDAQIMVEVYAKLTRANGADRARFPASVGQALRRNRDAMNALVLAKSVLPQVGEELAQARPRIARAASVPDGWSSLEDGLRRAYRRGHRAFAEAYRHPTLETFHEWRKGVKDLHYDMRLLSPIWPVTLESLGDTTDTLGDLLGDDHDLGVLERFLRANARGFGGLRTLRGPLRAIARRRDELRSRAKPIGEALYQDRPRIFVERIEALWHAWH